jgi:DNA-binding CsgD family transcriptional regulator
MDKSASWDSYDASVIQGALRHPHRRKGQKLSSYQADLSAYVRQLCVIGVDSRVLARSLLDALTKLVGADDFSGVAWSGRDYQIANFYTDSAEWLAMIPEYQKAGGPRLDREAVGVDFPTAMRRGYGWGRMGPENRQFARSAGCAFFSSLGVEHCLECTAVEGGRGWGSLMFARGNRSKAFSSEDEMQLRRLSPHIAHALRREESRSECTELTESGVVIVSARGHVIHQDPIGARLLWLCSRPSTRDYRDPRQVPRFLLTLTARVNAALQVRDAKPPVAALRNSWGRFEFRSYPLRDIGRMGLAAPVDRFAITISRYEPLVTRVARTSFALHLTPMQRQISICLASQGSYASIANQLHVKRSTVIDHVRKIYLRLDVHDHASLLAKLRSA